MDLLERVLKKILTTNPALKQGVMDAKILETWPLAVGPQLAKHARAVSMKGKTMLVEVGHPIWKQELHSNKLLALRRLNEKLNEAFPAPEGSTAAPKVWVEELFFLSPMPTTPAFNPFLNTPKRK